MAIPYISLIWFSHNNATLNKLIASVIITLFLVLRQSNTGYIVMFTVGCGQSVYLYKKIYIRYRLILVLLTDDVHRNEIIFSHVVNTEISNIKYPNRINDTFNYKVNTVKSSNLRYHISKTIPSSSCKTHHKGGERISFKQKCNILFVFNFGVQTDIFDMITDPML